MASHSERPRREPPASRAVRPSRRSVRAKDVGGNTDRSHAITQAIEIALAQDKHFQKALSARPFAPAVCHVGAAA